MAAGSLPIVRRAIIASDAGELRTTAREALGMASAAVVRARFGAIHRRGSASPAAG
jgi:hypothetical protein